MTADCACSGVTRPRPLRFETPACRSAPLDAVICAAGGWSGGGAGDEPDALVAGVEKMSAVCLQPALTAAHIAVKHLRPGGLLALVGSEAALHATPGMLGYGLAKAATHHLLLSVAPPASAPADGKRDPNALPAGCRAVAVLPRTLDTPSNRKWMGGGDTSTWTPLDEVAGRLLAWASPAGAGELPTGGTLVVPETATGKTTWRTLPSLYAPSA